jgi:hypothetical protein
MPTPSSGTIRFLDIRNEFGPNNISAVTGLGAYRISQSVGSLSNLPLDLNIPQSNTIKLSDFYNKRLNVVIDYSSIADGTTRLNARSTYDLNTSQVVVIGGFRGRPSNPQNIRLIINVNTRIGSSKGSITNCAVRTGNWRDNNSNALTTVKFEIGTSGKIYGAGGDGGNAVNSGTTSGSGSNGTSAIGIDYPTEIINYGRIQCGSGGGGAGAYRRRNVSVGKKRAVDSLSTGGGGGGGAGYPFSRGGISPQTAFGQGTNGSNGSSGSYELSGAGGIGGNEAGSGGVGGQFGSGDNGESTANQTGGLGGSAGYSIVISADGVGTTIDNVSGFGVEIGSRVTSTSPT